MRSFRMLLAAVVAACCLLPASSFAVERLDLRGLRSAERHDQFIVKYREHGAAGRHGATLQQSLDAVAAVVGTREPLTLSSPHRMASGAHVVRAGRTLDRLEAEALMRQLATDPAIEHVEVDTVMSPFMTPNDPHYPAQWSYQGGAAGIRANNAWDFATGAGVVVAVIDSGITSHEDLDANVLPGYDFITDLAKANDGDGRDADASDPGDWTVAHQCGTNFPPFDQGSTWHGTHTAGTIAAVTNNGKGVAGIAHGAKIVPIRVLGTCGGRLSDTADAIVWAAGGNVPGVPANPHPAEVINVSLGAMSPCGETYQQAIDEAVRRGATVVAAAGNEFMDAREIVPASCAGVIAVAALGRTGVRVTGSNYGTAVDIAAPGESILSTGNPGLRSPSPERNGTIAKNGTSMAAPHVAGVVALLQSHAARPHTPAQVEAILKATARPFPVPPSQPIGAGIVDALAAVQSAPPSALGLTVVGTPKAGYTLTAQYTYDDPEGDAEGGTTFQWYWHKPGAYLVPIAHALGKTYIVQASDIGAHRLLVTVKPRALTGTNREGREVQAQTHVDIAPGTAPVISRLTVAGQPIAGYTLGVQYDYADADGDPESGTRYQWYLHQPGKYLSPIEGAVSRTYTVKPTDIGNHRLLVKVIPRSLTGYPNTGAAVEAQTAGNVVPGSAPVAFNASVSGSPIAGQSVEARYAYNDADGDVEGGTSYQWYLHKPGEYLNAIPGATGKRYTVKPGDIGNHRLLVVITPRSGTGYPNVGAVAQAQTAGHVVPGARPVAANVSIVGSPRAGQTVTAQYSYSDADGDLEGATRFQWYLHQPGHYLNAIPGATGRTHAITPGDIGPHVLLVQVTPRSRTGYPDVGSAVQAQTSGIVIAGTAPVVSNLSISGEARAGRTVSAQYTYIDADGDPEGPTTFQWYLHQPGNYLHPLSGEVGRTYTVKASDVGNHRLLVVVTPRSLAGAPHLVGAAAQVQSPGNVTF